MKSRLKSIIIVMLILAVVSVIAAEIKFRIKSQKQDIEVVTEAQKDIDMSLYYTFSEVKKDVSYLAKDDKEEESLSRLVDALSESNPVNVAYIKSVCSTIGVDNSVYYDIINDGKDEDLITKEQFDLIYENIIKNGYIAGLEIDEIFVFDIIEDMEDDSSKISLFDGYNYYEAYVEIPDEYLNKIIEVYSKDGIIYKIAGYSDKAVVLKNVWIKSNEEGTCTFLYDSVDKTYASDLKLEICENCIADLTIDNSGVIGIDKSKNVINTRVTRVSDGYLFVDSETDSKVKISDDFKIYNVSEDAFCEKDEAILLGYSNIGIIREDGIAVVAVIRDELICDDIRVILSNDDYTSYDMESVIITSDGSYIVSYPDETKTTYESGAEVVINYSDYEPGEVISIVPKDNNGLKILSLNREYGNPVYDGDIEIDIKEDALNVINIVPLESYLYSVLSSEMPSGGYPEALKAMAVCYRSYAYAKLKDGSFADYNAHLDDSSLCQLYNDYELRDDCVQAVKDTYGIVASYKGDAITSLTYSTCYGVTSTNDEVWGGNQYEYFFSRVDNEERTRIDLSNEEDFKQFLTDGMGYVTVDKDMPYYRWSIDYTYEDMSDAIDSMLLERASISSDNIKIKTGEDTYEEGDISDIGNVVDIKVFERTKSGVVSSLLIEGDNAAILVTGSSNIRNLITPVNQQIVRQDGSVITGWTSLPSPYYYIEKNAKGFTVYGGGFGYGVGLSKNGAANLAEEGYNYKYIVHHYYAYVKFLSIYDNSVIIEESDTEEEINPED